MNMGCGASGRKKLYVNARHLGSEAACRVRSDAGDCCHVRLADAHQTGGAHHGWRGGGKGGRGAPGPGSRGGSRGGGKGGRGPTGKGKGRGRGPQS